MKKTINYCKIFVILTLLIMGFSSGLAIAQKATWIWYPGDYDIWLSNRMQNRRTERGTFYPPFIKNVQSLPMKRLKYLLKGSTM
jgi:alpha-L-rhamnosidase